MTSKRTKFWSGNNRFRLMLTLGLAVMLPAAALIYVNFHHLKSIKRDERLEAAIHRDFQQMLAVSEKRINQKTYIDDGRGEGSFPLSGHRHGVGERKGSLTSSCQRIRGWRTCSSSTVKRASCFVRSRSRCVTSTSVRSMSAWPKCYGGWFGMEGKTLVEEMHKKKPAHHLATPVTAKRAGGDAYMTTAFFVLPQLSKDRVVLGGASFDPNYLKQTFFPEMLEELIARKLTEEGGNQLAMMVYPTDYEGGHGDKAARRFGWVEKREARGLAQLG